MLLIVSTAKPAALDRVLRPLLEHQPLGSQVITPDEVPDYSGDSTLLLMGSAGFQLVIAAGLAKSNQKLGASREVQYQIQGHPALVTYDPGILEFKPELLADIRWDVNLALRLAKTGSLKPEIGAYHWTADFAEVITWALKQDQTQLTPITLDLETTGLDEFASGAQILTVQLSYRIGHSLVYRTDNGVFSPAVYGQLDQLFHLPWINVIGANLKFDMRWLFRTQGMEIENHRFDTQLVGSLVNENRYNSLKAHVKEYAPDLGNYETTFESRHPKAEMQKALATDPAEFLTYAGGDTDGALRIYMPLRQELCKDQALARFYARLLHPASIAFRKLEQRGILIDKPRYLQLQAEAEAEQITQAAECFAMMPNKIKYKYADNLKLTRDAIIRDFLFSPSGLHLKPTLSTPKSEGKHASCAWEHLKQFMDHPIAGPFVKKLKEYNATGKALHTYIIGFLEHLRSDGKFHPSYMLAKGGIGGDEDEGGGTNTGRSSCTSPAWQTLPKRTTWAKRLRSVVICPPGYVLIKLDFSQGELRIMADAANCKSMIAAYQQGLDLHAMTAAGFLYPNKPLDQALAQLLKLPDEEIERHRYGAKAGNFGLIYRISPEGYRQFAANSYDVHLTPAQAQANHAAFFKTYPEIAEYHKTQVAFARAQGYVRNQLGRVRHLPSMHSSDSKTRGQSERRSINAPTQACLFDMMLLLIAEIDKARGDIWLFGCTHDSLEMYLKEATWEADAKWIKGIAEHLPLAQFDWTPKVPFVVDFEFSATHMGDMKKVKIAA